MGGEIANGVAASSITMNRQRAKELMNYIYDLNAEINRLNNIKFGFTPIEVKKDECPYCRQVDNKVFRVEILGEKFDLQETAGYKLDHMRHSAWLMKNTNDKKAGIMFSTYNTEAVFFDIDYCPICGRRLR